MLDLEPLPTGNEDGVLRWGEAQDLVLAATILGIRFIAVDVDQTSIPLDECDLLLGEHQPENISRTHY